MARGLSIQVSQEDVQKVLDTISAEITNVAFNDIKDRNVKLQLAAAQFLEVALKTIGTIQQAELTADLVMRGAELIQSQNFPITTGLYKTYFNKVKIQKLQEVDILQDFFQASLIFNERIINILYDKPLKTVVIIPGETPQVYIFDGEQLLEANGVTIDRDFASKTQDLLGRLRFSAPKLEESVGDMVKILSEQGDNAGNLAHLNQAYADARFDYEKFLPTKYAYYRGSPHDVWKRIFISGGYGDLAEAYASFFLMGLDKFISAAQWPNLVIYFEDGVALVDNSSGLYSADILGDKANYAVKAAKADLPGYMQMLKLAQNIILASKGDTSVSWDTVNAMIKKEQQKAQNASQAIRNRIEVVTTEAVVHNLDEFLS